MSVKERAILSLSTILLELQSGTIDVRTFRPEAVEIAVVVPAFAETGY